MGGTYHRSVYTIICHLKKVLRSLLLLLMMMNGYTCTGSGGNRVYFEHLFCQISWIVSSKKQPKTSKTNFGYDFSYSSTTFAIDSLKHLKGMHRGDGFQVAGEKYLTLMGQRGKESDSEYREIVKQ